MEKQTYLTITTYYNISKGHKEGLIYKKDGHVKVKANTDTDYARSIANKRSTTKFCTYVGGNMIT